MTVLSRAVVGVDRNVSFMKKSYLESRKKIEQSDWFISRGQIQCKCRLYISNVGIISGAATFQQVEVGEDEFTAHPTNKNSIIN